MRLLALDGRSVPLETARVRGWWLCLVSLLGMVGAWSLALPVNGMYDEKQHLVRAYAVWTGQFIPAHHLADGADAIDGPRSLLPVNPDCTWRPKPYKPASCQQTVTDHTRTLVPTTAGR